MKFTIAWDGWCIWNIGSSRVAISMVPWHLFDYLEVCHFQSMYNTNVAGQNCSAYA